MRKSLIVVAAVAFLAAVVSASIAVYAIYNLNSLIAHNQARFLKIVSDALERPLEVEKVTARAGWGVWIEISGLKIADDPAFSQLPFLTAPKVTIQVDILPILSGHVRVHAMTVEGANLQLLENENGTLNVDSVGGPPGQSSKVPAILAGFSAKTLEISNGTVHYNQAGQKGSPIEIDDIDADIDNFRLLGHFDVDAKLAFLQKTQNVMVTGKVGPLLHSYEFNTPQIPLDLEYKADAIVVDQLKGLISIGSEIPPELSMPDPVSFSGSLKGPLDTVTFQVKGDMTAGRVAYSTVFSKPPNLKMNTEVGGVVGLVGDKFDLGTVRVQIGDMDATLPKISFPAQGPSQVQVETNSFDLAEVASTLPPLSSYHAKGKGEVHATFNFGTGPFSANGTATLKDASIAAANGKIPGVSSLNTTVVFKDTAIVVQPSTFSIAGARAGLQGSIASTKPLQASYQFDADVIRPAAFVPSRPADEVLNQIRVVGGANGATSAPQISARVTSASGLLAGAAYRNLDYTGGYANSRITANPLNVDVFSGSLSAIGDYLMGARPQFNFTARLRNIDLQSAFHALDPKTERRLRGLLTGTVKMAGAGKDWNAIEPTLNGSGSMVLTNGKLAGLNIVAIAINKIAEAPGVSQIVNATFMSNHQGMLADPDTELEDARMSFVLANERVTTHDLVVKSADYGIAGDGWMDLDNNISMSMDIQLTFGLSVTLPVYITGRAPVLIVVPDIPKLTERIAMGVISVPGKLIRGGISGWNTLTGNKEPSGSNTPSSSNPLDKLKSWIP